MKVTAIVGAIIGAVVGAALWAGISGVLNYELGYVAWGVGGLVGFGAIKGGGSGKTMAAYGAILALIAIFVGKMGAVAVTIPAMVEDAFEEDVTLEIYEETKMDAAAFADITRADQYPQFMIDRFFTDASTASEVPEEELEYFETAWVPVLREFQAEPLSYEDWRSKRIEEGVMEVSSELSFSQVVMQDLNFIDIIFAVFGITTAYGMIAKREET